jgi:hypothetical protein
MIKAQNVIEVLIEFRAILTLGTASLYELVISE